MVRPFETFFFSPTGRHSTSGTGFFFVRFASPPSLPIGSYSACPAWSASRHLGIPDLAARGKMQGKGRDMCHEACRVIGGRDHATATRNHNKTSSRVSNALDVITSIFHLQAKPQPCSSSFYGLTAWKTAGTWNAWQCLFPSSPSPRPHIRTAEPRET